MWEGGGRTQLFGGSPLFDSVLLWFGEMVDESWLLWVELHGVVDACQLQSEGLNLCLMSLRMDGNRGCKVAQCSQVPAKRQRDVELGNLTFCSKSLSLQGNIR